MNLLHILYYYISSIFFFVRIMNYYKIMKIVNNNNHNGNINMKNNLPLIFVFNIAMLLWFSSIDRLKLFKRIARLLKACGIMVWF